MKKKIVRTKGKVELKSYEHLQQKNKKEKKDREKKTANRHKKRKKRIIFHKKFKR